MVQWVAATDLESAAEKEVGSRENFRALKRELSSHNPSKTLIFGLLLYNNSLFAHVRSIQANESGLQHADGHVESMLLCEYVLGLQLFVHKKREESQFVVQIFGVQM